MSEGKQFFKKSSAYFIGHLIAMTSGLISMPVMTRVLTKEEYGTMALISITISLIGLITGLGIQDAVMRFYSIYQDDSKTQTQVGIGRFRDTAFTFCVSINALAILLLILGSFAVGFFMEQGPFMIYLRVAVILVLFRAAIDIYLAFYRAEGRAWTYSAVMISQHHLSIFFSVIFTLYLFHGLWGVYAGMILGEGIVTVLFFILLFRERMIKKPEWEGEAVRSIVQYGGPLLISSIATLVMNLGDRYVIKYYLDMESVANYSVPYQMALLVTTILFGPIRQMFFPYIFSLYENKGANEAGVAVSRAIQYLFVLMIPAGFGLSYLGRDLITVIASDKYAEASSLLPCLLLGLFSYGAYNAVMSSVPLLFKKTGTISLLTCLGGGINILLNIILIPFWGIWGAAIATAVTYLFMLFSTYFISCSYIKIAIDFRVILKAVIFSSLMLGVLRMMGDFSQYLLLTLIGKCLVGALVYGLLQAVFGEGIEKTRLLFRRVMPAPEEGTRP